MHQDIPQLSTNEEVMFFDTDIGGVVHNLAYLRMIETCRTKLATEVMKMPLKEMADSGNFPVVVSTDVRYHSPATLGDTLSIQGGLSLLEKARFWVEFEIYKKGSDKKLISCKQCLALVTMPSGRPQRLPQSWREQWPTLCK